MSFHAVGATGIFQAAECLWQLQQKYDKFHGDPKIWKKWGAGCVIVTLAVAVQRFASVTVTVYVPAIRPVAVAVE